MLAALALFVDAGKETTTEALVGTWTYADSNLSSTIGRGFAIDALGFLGIGETIDELSLLFSVVTKLT